MTQSTLFRFVTQGSVLVFKQMLQSSYSLELLLSIHYVLSMV